MEMERDYLLFVGIEQFFEAYITPFIPKVCCWVELLYETKLK
jgi:hypothetical protein